MLEPMKGKPMKDYVVVPITWRKRPETLSSWISKALEWSSQLPPKNTEKKGRLHRERKHDKTDRHASN